MAVGEGAGDLRGRGEEQRRFLVDEDGGEALGGGDGLLGGSREGGGGEGSVGGLWGGRGGA